MALISFSFVICFCIFFYLEVGSNSSPLESVLGFVLLWSMQCWRSGPVSLMYLAPRGLTACPPTPRVSEITVRTCWWNIDDWAEAVLDEPAIGQQPTTL